MCIIYVCLYRMYVCMYSYIYRYAYHEYIYIFFALFFFINYTHVHDLLYRVMNNERYTAVSHEPHVIIMIIHQ